jgi:putative zinc finger/helix-turn-helix YgiT family protein
MTDIQRTSASERLKKYPIRCIECGKKEVRPTILARDVKKNHDGRVYDLHISDLPATQCSACGEVYFTTESDERIAASLRDHLGLLTPDQIRANLESLKLNQKDTADRLGIAAETLCRWLSGAMIQSRAMDNLLRGFFACPELREKLTGPGRDRAFGVLVTSPK